MDERFSRTASLLGDEAVLALQSKRVMLLGLGGVGGYTCEALARAGVGELYLVDFDAVSVSNINRQILADDTTVGRPKTAVAAERIARISPQARVTVQECLVTPENAEEMILAAAPHYIIDAIDAVPAKIALIRAAHANGIPIVSCMGTGNKLYPERFQISDITKTHTCALARAVRRQLREAGIAHADVLWSSEPPRTPVSPQYDGGRAVPATVSYVPAVAGLMLAGFVIRRLLGIE